MDKFKIESSKHFRFYIAFTNSSCCSDSIITTFLNISLGEYRTFLLKTFQSAYIHKLDGQLYFLKYKDALDALNWINSVYILKKLEEI